MDVSIIRLLRDLRARGHDVTFRARWANVSEGVERARGSGEEHDARPVSAPPLHRVSVGEHEPNDPIFRRDDGRSRPSDAINPRVPARAVRALRKPHAAPGNGARHGCGHPSRHAGQPEAVRPQTVFTFHAHEVLARFGSLSSSKRLIRVITVCPITGNVEPRPGTPFKAAVSG